MRARGWKVWRLGQQMAWHDAAILRFGQWWMRTRRTGFGYAQGVAIGGLRERARVAQLLRPWFWAAALPAASLGAFLTWGAPGALLLLAYPLQVLRMTLSIQGDAGMRWTRAFFLMLGKLPELQGQLQFWLARTRRAAVGSFDYKS